MTLNNGGDDGRDDQGRVLQHEIGNKHGGVIIVGDYVYGDTDDSGKLYCVEVEDRQGRSGSAARSARAEGSAFDDLRRRPPLRPLPQRLRGAGPGARPTSYTEAGSFKIENVKNQSWSHPVVIGGKLYLREQEILWCYDVSAKAK